MLPVAEVVAEVPRLFSKSCRKVVRLGVLADVVAAVLVAAVLVGVEALFVESVETRLLKSVWSVLRGVFADEDEEVVEVEELSVSLPSCEINCSSLLEKFE